MTSVTGSNRRLLVAKLTDLLAPELRILLVAFNPCTRRAKRGAFSVKESGLGLTLLREG